MKVLLTTDTLGGVWTFAVDLARRMGEQAHLATMGRALSASQRADAAGLTLHESEYKLEWMPDPWADVDSSGAWLLELEARIRPDLVHLNSLVQADLPWRAPVILTAHSCVLSWWQAVRGEMAPPEWSEYRGRVARSLRAAALVVTPSQAMLDSLRSLYGFRGEARVIPNGRAAGLFAGGTKEPLILAAGRVWDEAKNLATLERVAPRLAWPVQIVGEGSAAGALAPAELARLLARAAIYAWPAKYEPFGLSVLEAALSGCALVLGDIPSLRENWSGTAEFVSSDEELERTLTALIAHPERVAELGRRARARALTFSAERMADAYTDVYERAMAGLCRS